MSVIPVVQPSVCEECARRFLPLDGGVCSVCGRTLCSWHLQLTRRDAARPPVCERCARAELSDPLGRGPA